MHRRRRSCQREEGGDDLKKGTQLLEVYALEIQIATEQRNNKRLKLLLLANRWGSPWCMYLPACQLDAVSRARVQVVSVKACKSREASREFRLGSKVACAAMDATLAIPEDEDEVALDQASAQAVQVEMLHARRSFPVDPCNTAVTLDSPPPPPPSHNPTPTLTLIMHPRRLACCTSWRTAESSLRNRCTSVWPPALPARDRRLVLSHSLQRCSDTELVTHARLTGLNIIGRLSPAAERNQQRVERWREEHAGLSMHVHGMRNTTLCKFCPVRPDGGNT